MRDLRKRGGAAPKPKKVVRTAVTALAIKKSQLVADLF
jgi:hypothetical protein